MLTSKAKYALRAMIDLATQGADQPTAIADIADRQDIPKRFLEGILLQLRRQGMVRSFRGKSGGYVLAKGPDEISFADVIRAIDGPLALAPCVSKSAYQRCADCTTEAECLLRLPLQRARDASAAALEATTLASAALGAAA